MKSKENVAPNGKSFNVKILMDRRYMLKHVNEYKEICKIFLSYKHRAIREGNWCGTELYSDEFLRGLILGTRQSVRVKTIATQTDFVEPEVVKPSSPSAFSEDFKKNWNM